MAGSEALAHPLSQFERCNHTIRFGQWDFIFAFSCNIERRPVIWRGADKGQAKGDIDPVIKSQCFDRNKGLIMARAQGNVISRTRTLVKQRIGRQRPFEIEAAGLQGFDGGDERSDLTWFPAWLLIEQPALAAALTQAQPSQHSAPEQAMRLLLELLGLERQGRQRELIEHRKRLRDLQASLYNRYMARR